MKRLIKKKAITEIRGSYDTWEEFEEELIAGYNFEPFEEYYVPIGKRVAFCYRVAIEGWYDDCLESCGLEETNPENIKAEYLHLMEKQFGFVAEKHNYLPNSNLSQYGVSYIARQVNI